jgi:hypothetical protein
MTRRGDVSGFGFLRRRLRPTPLASIGSVANFEYRHFQKATPAFLQTLAH